MVKLLQRDTGDQQVTGLSLTHCAAEYKQAARAHLPLLPSRTVWYCPNGSYALRPGR